MAAKKRRSTKRRVAAFTAIVAATGAGLIATNTTANADPSANDWYRLRMCESTNNYKINTGNGYYGAYQFDLPTWQSVGGRGYPHQASPAEQDARALMLYRMRGWQPWECAGMIGLRNDSDARSGYIADIRIGAPAPAPAPAPANGAPAWPGPRTFVAGDSHSTVARWQQQMERRGVDLGAASGVFGPKTLATVKRIQALNGMPQSGLLGPRTWALAWTGRWSTAPAAAPPAPAAPAPAAPSPAVPAWPGPRYFAAGDSHATIAAWQRQMEKRGVDLGAASGVFGPRTLETVKRIQRLNGLPETGLLGPATWRLAWAGKW